MDSMRLGWRILGAVALAGVAFVMLGPHRTQAPFEPAQALTEAQAKAPREAAPTLVPPPMAKLVETPTPAAVATAPAPSDKTVALVEVPPSEPVMPSFDLVRADPDGTTLIAGIATPGSDVSVLIDGVAQVVGSADGSGRFAQFLDLPPSDAPRVLTLRTSLNGTESVSTDEVILAAPPPPAPPEQRVPPQVSGVEIAAASPPSEAAGQAPTPVALLSTEQGVELVQPAGPPLSPGAVAIDAITYDTAGDVALSGRGSADAQVRIYLDNRSVATATVPQHGRWRADLPQIDAGTYTLRVDQMDAGGDVTARAESPFLRESPDKLAAVVRDADTPVSVVTVQPGHTLWALARDRYGDGFAYVKVFEANRSQIRDADLIYPGQVFDLPD